MKIVLLLLSFNISSCFFLSVNAQDNVLKVNILSPLTKTLTLSYEHVLSDTKSIQLTGYLNLGKPFGVNEDIKMNGYGFAVDYRFYLSDSYLKGFYLSPFFRLKHYSKTTMYFNPDKWIEETKEFTATIAGVGLLLGNQFLINRRFTIDIFAGPGYEFYINSNFTEEESHFGINHPMALSVVALRGFNLRGGVTLGYAF